MQYGQEPSSYYKEMTMQHINRQQESHLAEILRLLSMYRVLTIDQLHKRFPELGLEKLLSLIRRLEKGGRLIYDFGQDIVLYSRDCVLDAALISAFWVLLDFLPDVTYHTASDFPATLSFYTQSDGYDVIYAPEEKEILLNHALSRLEPDASHRLVIVERAEQIPRLTFPGITAYCIVQPDGQVHYYKKQGDSLFDG